ncbi:MAG: S8 family serine peptidase [Candidatus Lokiarchaeota archaeon]|nr:S8 family serine peptidase [Candidatus Lokiarchaeota archaeon]
MFIYQTLKETRKFSRKYYAIILILTFSLPLITLLSRDLSESQILRARMEPASQKLINEIKNSRSSIGLHNEYIKDKAFIESIKSTNNYDLSYDITSKLGVLLQEELDYIEKIKQFDTQEDVKLIIMFNEKTDQDTRFKTMRDLRWDAKIKKVYNIIPAISFSTQYSDLIEKISEIQQNADIYKVFLDEKIQINDNSLLDSIETSAITINNWWLDQIGASNLEYDGSGVTIAILDTGISQIHADFSGRVNHESFTSDELSYVDYNGHGTHCAGIAAGSGISSGAEYRGVAPNANLYNVKVANTSGSIEVSDVVSAVEFCTENDIDVMSMSFGFPYPEVYNPETAAIKSASEQGIVAVSSAGNSGPLYYTGGTPGAGISSISVGATDIFKNITSFSSLGPNFQGHIIPDVLAPGSNIISSEQPNSILSNYNRYTNSYISGSEFQSDYIPLSGTSMSCPMVAGAVAILLDAYPELTPEGVRIALYKGAYPPNGRIDNRELGNNGIGAGIINVTASLEYLSNQAAPYELISSLPSKLPIAPYDLLKYPGDAKHLNISILSSLNTSQNIDITLPEVEGLEITSDKTTLAFSNHSIEFLDIGIKILENSTIGLKSGLIYINKSGSDAIYDTINVTVDVAYPKGRIYFDSFHGLNDFFPSWSTGYMQIDIYDAMKSMLESGYKLDYSMANWSYEYNQWTDAELITPDKISLADIVVLQTPVIPYSDYEIEILSDYINSGGSILVLGTRYQALTRTSLNSLLNQIGCGIEINQENIFDYHDIGLGLQFNSYIVDDLNDSSSLFTADNQFAFWFGSTLDVESDADTYDLANLQEKIIVGGYDGEKSGRGNLVVWSDYHWLRNDVFTQNNLESNHTEILNNLLTFLHTNDDDYAIGVNLNTTVSNSGYVNLNMSVVNPNDDQPITTLLPGDSINVTLTDPLKTSSPIEIVNSGNGIYTNNSFYLNSYYSEPYTISINITGELGLIQRQYLVYKFDPNQMVEITDPTMDKDKINRNIGNSVDIEYSGNMIGLDVDLYASLTPNTIFNVKNSTDYSFGLSGLGSSYSNTYSITGNEDNSGYFVFYAIGNNTGANLINFKVERDLFEVTNHDPEIDELNSYIGDIPFNQTQDETYIYAVQAKGGMNKEFIVETQEKVLYEDEVQDLNVIVTYLTAATANGVLYPMLSDTIPFKSLSYSESQELFQGSFYIPKELVFTGTFGSLTKSQEYVQGEPYYSLIWLTVRDSEGGWTDYLFLLIIEIPVDIGDYWPIILTSIGILALIIVLYYVSKRRQGSYLESADDYDHYASSTGGEDFREFDDSSSEQNFKYCMFCGKKININSTQCPYCGQDFLP